MLRAQTPMAPAAAAAAQSQQQAQSQLQPQADDESERGPAQAVEAYMERLSLKGLLAQYLEERLATANKADRVPTAERLGRLYVDLLGSAASAGERSEWEAKAHALLSQVPEADSLDLRLSLARAVYVKAEEVAERHRLRLASPEEAVDAEKTFRTLAEQLGEIGGKAHRRVEQLERVESAGDATERLAAELAEARRVRSTAYYFAGWSNVYLAWLGKAEGPAVEATRDFGWLLNAMGGRQPSIDKAPTEKFRYEHVARAAVGVGLAASERGNDTEALRWLTAVEEAPDTPQAVRDQLVSRRMAVLAHAKRWSDLDILVRRTRRADRSGGGPELTPLPTPLARLLAVLTLEAEKKVAGPQIEALAKIALGDLVARKEAGQVLDLVNRYGTAPIGETGFIVHYVRALQQYETARKAQEASGAPPDEPADAAAATAYRNAAAMFKAALEQDDARGFKAEAARAGVMRGRSLLMAGDALQAGDVLLAAHKEQGKGAAGEEPLWLAVLAYDRAAREKSAPADVRRKLEAAVALFLQAYPDSERAPRLVLMQVSLGSLSDDEALKVLGAVPRESPMYDAARRQLARILYTRFRSARGPERDFAAGRFVAVAEDVLAADRKAALEAASADAPAAVERVAVRARQLLDALLTTSTPDVKRADSVLKLLRGLASTQGYDLGPFAAELAFREMQIALAKDDEAGAEEAFARVASARDVSGLYQAAAERTMYRRFAQRFANLQENDPAGTDVAQKTLTYGAKLVDRLGATSEALKDPAVLGVYSTVAGAAMQTFRRTGDAKLRDLALRLDGAVLGVQPRNEASLRRVAEASEGKGEFAAAASAWRTILAARTVGEEAWFEARHESIRLLAKVDPVKARQAIDEHKAVYPDFGPEPWGPRLQQLDEQIPALPAPPAPSGADGGAGAAGGGGGAGPAGNGAGGER